MADCQSKLFCFTCRYIISMNSTAMNNMSTTDNENNAENYPSMLWIAPTSLALLIITGNSMVIGACFHFAKSRSYTLNFILALSVADIATGMGMVFNVFTRINADILSYKIPCILSYEVFFTMALISVNGTFPSANTKGTNSGTRKQR